jgi:hypothetical protein
MCTKVSTKPRLPSFPSSRATPLLHPFLFSSSAVLRQQAWWGYRFVLDVASNFTPKLEWMSFHKIGKPGVSQCNCLLVTVHANIYAAGVAVIRDSIGDGRPTGGQRVYGASRQVTGVGHALLCKSLRTVC